MWRHSVRVKTDAFYIAGLTVSMNSAGAYRHGATEMRSPQRHRAQRSSFRESLGGTESTEEWLADPAQADVRSLMAGW